MNHKTLMMAGIAALIATPALAQTAAPAAAAPATAAPAMSPAAGATSTTTTTTTAPAAGASTSASTTTTAKVTPGAAVSDAKGGAVGTIDTVEGQFAVLSTGTNKVRLPLTSFAQGTSGLVIGMTKAEVDAAASGAAASSAQDVKALVVAGAQVNDASGAPVGKVESVEGEFAVVATANSKARLPLTAFAKGVSGPVIAMSAAELDAAAKAAAPSGGK